jgi:hypothetical protein
VWKTVWLLPRSHLLWEARSQSWFLTVTGRILPRTFKYFWSLFPPFLTPETALEGGENANLTNCNLPAMNSPILCDSAASESMAALDDTLSRFTLGAWISRRRRGHPGSMWSGQSILAMQSDVAHDTDPIHLLYAVRERRFLSQMKCAKVKGEGAPTRVGMPRSWYQKQIRSYPIWPQPNELQDFPMAIGSVKIAITIFQCNDRGSVILTVGWRRRRLEMERASVR